MKKPSPEVYANICALADKLTKKNVNLSILNDDCDYPIIAYALQDHFKNREKRKLLLLPELTANNKTIAVFSDYGGESLDSKYYTYSFLVCAWDHQGHFHERMKYIRKINGLDRPLKEISFKDFGYGPIKRSLDDYLAALSNLVNGLLLTVTVEKKIKSIFLPKDNKSKNQIVQLLEKNGFGSWKYGPAEKLIRAVNIASYLVALLSSEGQKVFWMTDADAIAPNTDKAEKWLNLFSNTLKHYSHHNYELISGATPFEEKSPMFLDLLSATDIVAGSIEHYFTRGAHLNDEYISSEADKVLQFLVNDGVSLKKHSIIIREGDGGALTTGTLEFNLKEVDDNATIIPVVRA